MLNPWLGERLSLVTLFPAAAAAVWISGYRAALIPAVVGYIFCFSFFGGRSWADVSSVVTALTYGTAIFCVIATGESMRRHRSLAERRRDLIQVTLRSIGDGVITTDQSGIVTDMNDVAIALTGVPRKEAVGRSVEEVFRIINEDSREAVVNPVLSALNTGQVVGLANHTILLSKTGIETPIDDTAAPIFEKTGKVVGGILVFRDVSKRRLAERSLRESENRNHFLANLAMAVQEMADPDEIMRRSAESLAQFLGADRCAYAVVENASTFVITGEYGPSVSSIIGRWDVAAFGPECVRQMAENEAFVVYDALIDPRVANHLPAYEATAIRAVICVPLHKDGKFTAAMAVHQTRPRQWTPDEIELVRTIVGRCWESLERARANLALQKSAERLTLALAAAQLGDWTWDANSDLVDLSPRAAEIFGTTPTAELTWSALQGLIEPDDAAMARSEVQRAVARRQQYDVEYRLPKPDGSCVWVSAIGRASYSPSGDPLGMFGIVQDATSRKQLEQELRVKAEHLALADRQKDDFIALLAHELRNPLAPVRTGLEVLKQRSSDPVTAERIRSMMERQLDHMVRLVDDLLDVSRITRNKMTLDVKPVRLAEIIAHTMESIAPITELAGQSLTSSPVRADLFVNADPTRLGQVLGNLLVNASKFSPQRSTIEIICEESEDSVAISIRDHGIGISPEELPKVFERFSQAEHTLAASKGGLGLGLYLARTLAELQGCSVIAASEGLGLGSTFTLRMPVLNFTAISGDGSSSQSLSVLDGMKVLVADDNADALEALSLLLATRGSTVTGAENGMIAVKLWSEIRPDLVLMDVGMPQMDGLQAAHEIRKLPGGELTIVVALTGWGRAEDRARTDAAGFDGHLVKPVRLDDLEDLVQKISATRGS